ncbi:MAG: hypothetical protein ACTSQ8_12830 [Candidatus Helarchaeota archaeon]|uniref:Universal stress protein n=1 Tax=candidate division WOR-3 bacterium TaxID=2052148 RepID=A0A9C9EMK8_UNCW3|nr:hypothetical protein [candidate division WOR-3 bacterium]
MKFKKVILLFTEETDQSIIEPAVQLCKKFKSRLFVLFVVETGKISRLARLTHQKVELLHRRIEETGWQLLYLTEDEAVQNGVWTSLHIEEGYVSNVLKKYIQGYGIDLVFIKKKDETKKIFVSCPVPVIGL